MPITPYTTPVQFEYKPLNLAAFAVPLGKMQEQFDLMKATVSSTDFDLSHLPYGTDPEKAKELIATAQEKRDELAKSLLETKNYKQAATKLMELNKAWKLDPEKQALESNYALWKKRDDEERARIDSGKPNQIKRDQYLQWRSDEIAKYEEAGGAGFKASYERPEGDYKKITGDTGRLSDLEDELQELGFKVGNAMRGEKRETALKMMGIDPTTLDAHFQKTILEELSSEKVAAAVRAYILQTQPKFKDWASEIAKYDFADMARSENFPEYGAQIVDRELRSNSEMLKEREAALKKAKKKKEDDPVYTNLVEREAALKEMKTTGEYDKEILSRLYTEQHLKNTFNFKTTGDVFAYRNWSVEDQFRSTPDGKGSGTKSPFGDESFFSPETDTEYTVGGFQQQIANANVKIKEPLKTLNGYAQGNVRAAIFDGLSESEKEKLRKDFGAQVAKNRNLFTAFENSSNSTDFIKEAKKRGITLTPGRAATLYKSWADPSGIGRNQFSQTLQSLEGVEAEYNTAKENLNTLTKSIESSKEFQNQLYEMGNSVFTPVGVKREIEEKFMVGFHFKEADFKKAGLTMPTTRGYLTFAEMAKLNGYKSFGDAVKKGFDFYGVVMDQPGRGALDRVLTPKEAYNQLLSKNIDKAPQEMAFNLLNTPEASKKLSQMTTTMEELMQHDPAFRGDYNNAPGFDAKGNLKKGTKLLVGSNYAPVIQVNGNQLNYKYYYEYIDEETGGTKQTSISVKPKKGMDPKTIQFVDGLLVSTSGNDAASEATKDMLLNTKFDLVYKNTLNESNYNAVPVKKGQKTTIQTLDLPQPGQKLIFKKEYPENAVSPVIKIYTKGADGVEKALDVNGVPGGSGQKFTASDVLEAKRFAASLLVDVDPVYNQQK
jgi:hypothetical protein